MHDYVYHYIQTDEMSVRQQGGLNVHQFTVSQIIHSTTLKHGSGIVIPCSAALSLYTRGVDHNDQLQGYYMVAKTLLEKKVYKIETVKTSIPTILVILYASSML